MEIQKWRGRDLKRRVFVLLTSSDLSNALRELCQLPARQVINPLFSFLSSAHPILRWNAITALGAVVAQQAQLDMEWARVIMRRLMWSLNDESGGIGWGAPEAMGEIMARHHALAREYAHMLLSYIRPDGNFLEHGLLQRGVVWALGRMAQVKPETVEGAIPYLLPYLKSGDQTIRGLAAWTMGLLRAKQARPLLEGLLEDNAPIELYVNNRLTVFRINELAREALAALAVARES